MSAEMADSEADKESPGGTLCRQILATEWPLLAAPIRAVHERRPVMLIGRASVVRGTHWLARLIGWVTRLPPEQHNGPVRVLLEQAHSGMRERWTRYFGTARPMRSSLRRIGNCVEETLGMTQLRFRYSLEGGSIRWTAVSGRTLGVSWPQSWLKGIEASESDRHGQYYFDVRAALPGVGLVVHYVGELEVAKGLSARIDAPIVVFDSVCVLCCAGLHWIVRHDRRGHWRFLAMQSRRGAAALTAAGISPNAPVSFLVLYAGRSYAESEACLVIARDVGGIWKVLATLGKVIPRALRDVVYRLVARNRYRWFGRRQSCYLPGAGESHRFLAD